MSVYYVAFGHVRGSCAHKHRTIQGAVRCIAQDQRDCAKYGYSDRGVRVFENDNKRDLTASEWDEVQFFENKIYKQ